MAVMLIVFGHFNINAKKNNGTYTDLKNEIKDYTSSKEARFTYNKENTENHLKVLGKNGFNSDFINY